MRAGESEPEAPEPQDSIEAGGEGGTGAATRKPPAKKKRAIKARGGDEAPDRGAAPDLEVQRKKNSINRERKSAAGAGTGQGVSGTHANSMLRSLMEVPTSCCN